TLRPARDAGLLLRLVVGVASEAGDRGEVDAGDRRAVGEADSGQEARRALGARRLQALEEVGVALALGLLADPVAAVVGVARVDEMGEAERAVPRLEAVERADVDPRRGSAAVERRRLAVGSDLYVGRQRWIDRGRDL